MDRDKIKWAILHRLNKERAEHGPHSTIDAADIHQELGTDPEETENAVSDLQDHGFIRFITMRGMVITRQGIALIDDKNPFVADLRQDVKSISINAPVSGTTIVQGNNNNVIGALNFIARLEKEIENSSLSEEGKKTWLGRLKEFSSHPLLVEVLSKALDLSMKANGPG